MIEGAGWFALGFMGGMIFLKFIIYLAGRLP